MTNRLCIISIVLLIAQCHIEPELTENNIAGIQVSAVHQGYARDFMWAQAYVAVIPGDTPTFMVTMSKKYTDAIDSYGNLYYTVSNDMGITWTEPKLLIERVENQDGTESVLSDVYPKYHKKTGKVLATGKVFLYDPNQRPDPEIGRRAGYIVYDPEKDTWSSLKMVKFPEKDNSGALVLNPTFGCIQRYDEPDGSIKMPFNYNREPVENVEHNISAVASCSFDGIELTYVDHGSELTIDKGRGLYEPSVIKFKDTYYLTLRADHAAFVSTSSNGLTYEPVKEWTFADDSGLVSYNTQQHWAGSKKALYLVYTRKGADNDHIFRHRAPLFIGRVNPADVKVIKSSEAIVIPERGARLGNFGVNPVNDTLLLVSAAEHMEEGSEEHGADNSVFVSMITWNNRKAQKN